MDSPDMRAVLQRYQEGREILMQAVIDCVDDPFILRRVAERLRELEERRDSMGIPFFAHAKTEKLSFVDAATEPPSLPRKRIKSPA
jgi:hypothetical protein